MSMKIIMSFSFLLLLLSCGKSPLLLKKNNETSIINGLESNKSFKTTNHSLILNWLSPINITDEGHALLIVKKNNVASDLPGEFKIFLWMPTMGHGSSPIAIKKLGTGLYDLSRVYFTMDGLWQLRIQLKSGTTVLEEQTYEYTL